MNYLRTRAVRAKVAALAGLGAILLTASVVLASSYWSTIWFDTTLTGSVRYYDGQNITISMISHTERCCNATNTYQVSLYRRECWAWCSNVRIGTVNVPRTGHSGNKTWSNVGPGNYYFYFQKTFDGVLVWSDNVWMRN